MAIAVEPEENSNKTNNQENQGALIRKWLDQIQKSLDFIYKNEREELCVSEVLSGDAKFKVFDPYSDLSAGPLKRKIQDIEGNRSKSSDLDKVCGPEVLVKLSTGEELHGNFKEGRREGLGTFTSPRLGQLGIKHLSGYYEDGILTGQGKIHMADETLRHGWFHHGYFHGPCRL